MAVVGPRPQLPGEASAEGADARRLLVKPGLTGLWQIGSAGPLSAGASIRLDLRYVENWSPALDLLVLKRTLGAVHGVRDTG
jgi:lipopolysaccharide/colanic/teichoic acid biosynthesis glycosyltransferase